jgi:hypothetical protein
MVFNKGKKNRTPSTKKPFSRNGIDEIRTIFKELTTIEKNHTNSPISSEEKNKSLKPKVKDLENEYLHVRQESETSRMGMSVARKQEEEPREQAGRHQHEGIEEVSFEKPDANTIINGIIWSEILGEPRSKKPYIAKRR